MLSSSAAIAQGPASGTAAQERLPDAPTAIRDVEPTGPTLTHYFEGVLVPRDVTLQGSSVIGARIRIMTTSTVEVPGLIRLDRQTITGRVLLSDGDTVTTSDGLDRPKVTLPRPRRTVVGVIAGLQQETLTLTREDGLVLTVPRGAIASLERQVGERSRKRGAALGLLIGGGAGAGIGFVVGNSCHSTAFLGCFMEPAAATVGGLILGAVAGTVTGAFFGPRQSWQTVPLSWLTGEGVI
jgi:hypothetical protein